MKKLNLGKPSVPGPTPSGSSPQRLRILIILLVGVILVAGIWFGSQYLLAPKPPPPARPLPQVVQPPAKPAPPPPVVAPVAPKVEEKAPLKPEAPVAEKAPPPPKKAEVKEKKVALAEGRYSLQVATLIKKENARSLEKKLREIGYSPQVTKGRAVLPYHRVVLGEYSSKGEAEAVAERLRAEGYRPTLVSLEGGRLFLEVMSSNFLDKAINMAHKLQAEKYNPRILTKRASTDVYRVRVGPFPSREEVSKVEGELRAHGLYPLIIKDR